MARRARKRRAGARPSAPPPRGRAISRPGGISPAGNGHDAVPRGERPDSVSPDERPDTVSPDERPDTVSPDERPDAVSPREPSDTVSPGERPDAVSPAGNGREAISPPTHPREAMARGYARAREKDEAAREALVPLAPGERPWPIALSAILAAVFAVANVVLVVAGWEGESSVAAPLIFAAVMLAAAAGMWRLKYWAVLGWEVLLGVTFIGALLSLLRASNVWGTVLAVIVMALTGPLFYLLIRQMARIQMPTRK